MNNGVYCGGSGRPPSTEAGLCRLSRKIEPNRQERCPILLIISISSKEAIKARSQVKLPPPDFSQGTQDRSTYIWPSVTVCPDPRLAPGLQVGHQQQQNNGVCIHVKIRQHDTIGGTGQQAHENDTHTVGLRHTRMKENIPTPARADQLGDGTVTKLWHKAAAPIPGLGCNYNPRTTATFNGPGPSELHHALASVFSCADRRW